MTLAAALTAYAELVGDVLVNDCGQPTPSRVLRYHGHAPPDDLDCGDGILSVWWGPNITPSEIGKGQPCSGFPTVRLYARWSTCWKVAEVDDTGIRLFDETWDADAARLADAAECVSRVLMRVACASEPEDPKSAALLALSVNQRVRFLTAEPTGASGLSAGIVWTTEIGLRAETSS